MSKTLKLVGAVTLFALTLFQGSKSTVLAWDECTPSDYARIAAQCEGDPCCVCVSVCYECVSGSPTLCIQQECQDECNP